MRGEPGAEAVRERLAVARISAVNLSEVVAKLQDHGVPDAAIADSLAELALDVVAFDEDQAIDAGKLRRATRHAGLSLGDRACLALARSLAATALTTDRAWEKAAADARVELVR
ncbi:MAG: type II toxin-antitoxin system VapC family toxin [Caulobacteraceae bacterium]|nr:type II toxin-antitoxin system VapC family toxin [Caulobacteraceae bacterium]